MNNTQMKPEDIELQSVLNEVQEKSLIVAQMNARIYKLTNQVRSLKTKITALKSKNKSTAKRKAK